MGESKWSIFHISHQTQMPYHQQEMNTFTGPWSQLTSTYSNFNQSYVLVRKNMEKTLPYVHTDE